MNNATNNIKYSDFCGKKVSNLAYGCATLAELYNTFKSQEYLELLEYSFNNGINYFDVAPFYGGGLAELRLGEFLNGTNIDRNDLFISTKVGRYTENNSLSGAGGYFDFSPSKID